MQEATSVAVPARDMGETLRASLAGTLNTLVSAIPRVLGFAIILIVGWLISSLLAKGVVALLNAIRFNDLSRRSGFADFVAKMGVRTDSTGVIANVAKWFVRLITLVVAFDMLGLPAVSGIFQQLLLWLPNLVVGLVVLVIGGLAANALSNLVRGTTAQAGFSNPDVLATVTKVAVWAFSIVVAVNQLGIATTLINTLLVGVVGALALATGLAFGLGGRDRAARLLDEMSRRTTQPSPRLERATVEAIDEAREAGAGLAISDPDENRVLRSGYDRRRVTRPGIDRRAGGNGSAG
jgi:hypothetical protein